MRQSANHEGQLIYLKKIEGQIRGVQKMIEEKRYCVDIMTQLHSIVGATLRVEENVFKTHLESCVKSAIEGKSEKEIEQKIDEILDLIVKFKKR